MRKRSEVKVTSEVLGPPIEEDFTEPTVGKRKRGSVKEPDPNEIRGVVKRHMEASSSEVEAEAARNLDGAMGAMAEIAEGMAAAIPKDRSSAVDLFVSNNKRKPTKRRNQLQRIIKDVFDVGLDIEAEYKYLRDALTVREDLGGKGTHRSYANEAEDNSRRAHRLYVIAKNEVDRIKAEIEPTIESMREAAREELQDEKDKGKRSKAITNGDVTARAARIFADEWFDAQTRLSKAEGTCDHVKHLVECWVARCYSARTMLESAR